MENIKLIVNIILAIILVILLLIQKSEGGALGIGVGDKVIMLHNSWYSVISPENCSTILWGNWQHKEVAADALKLTAKDMKKIGLVDEIIKEPLGGAHTFPKETFRIVKKTILKAINELIDIDKNIFKNDNIMYEHQEDLPLHECFAKHVSCKREPKRDQPFLRWMPIGYQMELK